MTYAVVLNRYGGYKVWLKNGRAKWYVDVSREGLTALITKLEAEGYVKYQP